MISLLELTACWALLLDFSVGIRLWASLLDLAVRLLSWKSRSVATDRGCDNSPERVAGESPVRIISIYTAYRSLLSS